MNIRMPRFVLDILVTYRLKSLNWDLSHWRIH